ncbi:MAG: DVUA0089 family protein [Terracidiphilus sp.]
MKNRAIAALCLFAVSAISLPAESPSYTGTLSSPEDTFETTFTLTATDLVTFQTWGFGDGTNAAGQVTRLAALILCWRSLVARSPRPRS